MLKNKHLILIVLAAFLIRVIGITHGFPFIFHPDEPSVVRSALGLRFFLNPKHFDWPHLHFYLNFVLFMIYKVFRGGLQFLGLQNIISSILPLMWRDPLVFYFISRLFSAVLGALTSIPIYLAGRRIFSEKVGLISALVIAIMPFHVHASHFALIDVPMMFWLSFALYFSSEIYFSNNLKNYVLAGLFVGLAASTKYNGGLSAVFVVTAHLFRVIQSEERVFDMRGIKLLVLSGVVAAVGFVAGTPFSVLDFDTFIRTDSPVGAFWQFTNVGKVSFIDRLKQFVYVLTLRFSGDYGYTFILIYTFFSAYVLITRKSRRLFFLVVPSLLLFFYTSGFSKIRSHYFITAYPFVSIIVGYFLYETYNLLASRGRSFAFFAVFLAFALPLVYSLLYVSLLVRKDTRNILYERLLQKDLGGKEIIYDSNELNPVMEKFEGSERHEIEPYILKGRSGYVVVSLDEHEKRPYFEGSSSKSFLRDGYKEVGTISSQNRRGPYIVIYEIN